MAGGVGFGPSNGKEYPGKLTWEVFKTCFVAALGGLIFGYDLGISGGVTSMAPFLKKFFPAVYRKEELNVGSPNQYCKFDSPILTLFTSSLYIAALLSSMVASTVTRKLGRRVTMVCGGVLFLGGAIVNAAAMNVPMLIIGRLLLGFGIGCANQSVPIYLSEMAPYKYRGTLNIVFQLMITIGILIANILNYFFAKIAGGWGWRLSLGGAAVPGLLIAVGALFLPDTPNSLIERGKQIEAKEQLLIIRGVDNVDMEFNDLLAASEASKKVAHPWRNIFTRKYRPQLVFAFFIPFFQQLTGMNVITFYAPVLFKTVGFGASASLMSSVITGAVNCVATLVAMYAADRCGRRKLFIEGGSQMLVAQIVITVCIAFKFGWNGTPGEISQKFAYLVVVFICIYVAAFAWSWGPLGWLVPSEIFPLEIRSAAQSINVCTNMFFTFCIAQVFTAMLCHMRFCLFVFFACFVVIMSIFIYTLLPETKGIPIEEMEQVWRKHWYWKRFMPDENGPKDIQITDASKEI